jgi:hypothetical protein
MRRAAACSLALLAACQGVADDQAHVAYAPPPDMAMPGPRGEAKTYSGRLSIGFERSNFEGCWLNLGSYWETLEVPPMHTGAAALYEISFIGRRTDMVVPPGAEMRNGFGHMGSYACQYDIEELLSSRRVQ